MAVKLDRRSISIALAASIATAANRGPDPRLASQMEPAAGTPMASLGIIARRGDGSAVLRLNAGRAFRASRLRPFNPALPFRVASVSKMIAATVFLSFASRSGLGLDGDVSDLLGFRLRHPAWPHAPVTPRMLLGHTSGLRNGPSYPVPFGRKLAEAFTPKGRHYDAGGWFGPAANRPGTWFAYADVNFALLAQILERLTGERFDLYMQRSLFKPLGLDIGYNWSGVSDRRRAEAAAGVRWLLGTWTAQVDGEVLPAPWIPVSRAPDAMARDLAKYAPGENGFLFSPQGGLRLSLSDMDRLARVLAGGGVWRQRQVIPSDVLALLQMRAWTCDNDRPNGEREGVFKSYGLGCETPAGLPGPDGDTYFGADTRDWRGHSGDAYGWITGVYWNIRDGRSLVYAINGMPETGRPPAERSSLTAPEEVLIDLAMEAFAKT